MIRFVYKGKPIIGMAGGIGSGKSHIARIFGELGCVVINADDQVDQAYRDPAILEQLRQWWGQQAMQADGSVDRQFVASRIFNDQQDKQKLEGMLHPYVARLRQQAMQQAADDSRILAYVWDIPLLFETGLNQQCDAVIFVDTPVEIRRRRVAESRGWNEQELTRRENMQWPLDRKQKLSEYILTNTDDDSVGRQVRQLFFHILASKAGRLEK